MYQWMFDDRPIIGATTTACTVCPSDVLGSYSVVVTNVAGSATSSNAMVSFYGDPLILVQPQSQEDDFGSLAEFSVSATGTIPLSYQWLFNGTAISAQTNNVLSIYYTASGDIGSYTVIVTNIAGSVTSEVAALTLNTNWVSQQPQSQTVAAGSTAYFYMGATSDTTVSYQWQFGGTNLTNSGHIAGADTDTLTIFEVTDADAGNYDIVISNLDGINISTNALLTVDDFALLGQWDFDRLLDWWTGDGNANDSAGPNNGTFYGDVSYASGESGQAFNLDGSSSYIDFGPGAGNFGTNDFTIDFWIETSAPDAQQAVLSKRVFCGANSMFDIRAQPDGTIGMETCEDESGTYYASINSHATNLLDGSFHHVVFVRQGVNQFLYIDEGLDNSITTSGIADIQNNVDLTAGSSPCIGCDSTGYLTGMLEDIKLSTPQPWVGDQGQSPINYSNILSVTSWSGQALEIKTNTPAILAYNAVEPSGSANIDCPNGSIRFWYAPLWNSTTTNSGTGPQTAATFIDLGSFGTTNDWFCLMLNSNGTQMSFCTETNGTATTNLSATISWPSNQWHQVGLTFCSTNSSLYIDGAAVATNGTGVTYWPRQSVRAQGLLVGSDTSGYQQMNGVLDVLQIFNYPLDAVDIALNYQAAMTLDNNGAGVPAISAFENGVDRIRRSLSNYCRAGTRT